MKILLTSLGTRGDIEPFLAIGELLLKRGHEVTCLFPEQFRQLVDGAGLKFESLGPEFLELLDTELGMAAMGGDVSQIKKILAYIKLAKIGRTTSKKMFLIQHDIIENQKFDKIVYHPKTIFPVIWEIKNPGTTMLLSPVPYIHYTKGHTHLAFNSNYGEFFNKMTYKLADWGLYKTISSSIKWIENLNISNDEIKRIIKTRRLLYAISPQLFEIDDHKDERAIVLGYRQREYQSEWHPDEKLLSFLSRHKKPLFITFGSMTNPEPENKTRIFMEVLAKNKIPAIFNTASGGIQEPDKYNQDLFFFVNNIPYDWILKRVHAVIHHGGSGTTHSGLKFGCPTLIVPHIIDQFLWNKLIYEKGAGPRGIKIGKISTENLEPKILGLMHNSNYRKKADEIAEKMQNEDYEEVLLSLIEEKVKVHI
ncbi:glycosyltransferase [Mangrovivirga cuniculi]|uniref:UDP-glucose--sterol glucosyltransferase n=1 Tax=Mangrovivirga cuniculi TaxID=2715131 RepID=A0A4D7JJN0_9BACT|nr:glycosyltransferase [Mangrovivirga cuniculi]QCK15183.1 UDP-glucose--sterol glucosyltransferase [Mangrovivirga cuniculi]